MQAFVEEGAQGHWRLGLSIGVMALVKLVLKRLLVAVGGDRHHLPPQAVVLAVGEPEDVGVA